MFRFRKLFILPLLSAMLLAGCVTGNKEFGGTMVGAGLGGFLGSQIGSGSGQLAATAAGTLLGAFLGNEVGKSLDRADRLYAERAVQQAHTAPIGRQVAWRNPNTGNFGTVTPTREGRNVATGAYCREYQTTVTVGGRIQRAYGTACMQPDGSWQVV